ncbi:MAG: hypothetical protein WCH43_02845 [Verrucomicrobiota bacterium]
MKRFIFSGLLVVTAIYLSACAGPDEQNKKKGQHKYGYNGDEPVSTTTETLPPTSTSPDSAADQAPKQDTTTPQPPPPTDTAKTQAGTQIQKKDYAYGTPVPNKPGFVTSPHAPYAGYVDVRGFPPGTEVKDPYTGKIFLVP